MSSHKSEVIEKVMLREEEMMNAVNLSLKVLPKLSQTQKYSTKPT